MAESSASSIHLILHIHLHHLILGTPVAEMAMGSEKAQLRLLSRYSLLRNSFRTDALSSIPDDLGIGRRARCCSWRRGSITLLDDMHG